jgi:putative tryptophan/tyrosine transport system substrate-binding protein
MIAVGSQRSVVRKGAFCLALCAMLFALCVSVSAQQPRKVFRVGILENVVSARTEAFRQGMRDLGHVEGQNFVIVARFGSDERLRDLADELVKLNVDVIFAPNTNAIQAAKKATRTIPIVMAVPSDAIGSGFVASLARPGGNITGLTSIFAEVSAKRLELFKETLPRVNRVAVLADASRPWHSAVVKALEETARALRLMLKIVDVRHAGDLDRASTAIAKDRAEALFLAPNPVFFVERKKLADFSSKHRLPMNCVSAEFAEAGCLIAYGADSADLYRRAATYVDKILKGTKPADLPVEQPTKFELVINLKTAKQIGLTIPPNVLARADKVIK